MIQIIRSSGVNCPNCGKGNPNDNRYCGMCGTALNRRGAPETELQPEDSEPSFISPAAERAAIDRGAQGAEAQQARTTRTEPPLQAGFQAGAAEISSAPATTTSNASFV